jgi:hypothetical protein
MASEDQKWYDKPTAVNVKGTVIAAGVLFFVKLSYDWYTATPVLSTFLESYNYVIAAFSSFFNYEIKLWWLLGGVLSVSIIRFFVASTTNDKQLANISDITQAMDEYRAGKSTQVTETVQAPTGLEPSIEPARPKVYFDPLKKTEAELTKKMLEFQAMKYKKFIFKWTWWYNELIKEYEVKDITPCCPRRECNNNGLKFTSTDVNGEAYKCTSCNSTFYLQLDIEELEPLIQKEVIKRRSPFYEHNERMRKQRL